MLEVRPEYYLSPRIINYVATIAAKDDVGVSLDKDSTEELGRDQALVRLQVAKANLADTIKRCAQGAVVLYTMLRVRATPSRKFLERIQPDLGDPDDWSFLRRPAVLGLVAIIAICVGATLPSSPFKLEMPGTWFFGEPSLSNLNPSSFLLFGLIAVYGGMLLLLRVWYGLWKVLRERPGVPIKYLSWILVLWILPLLVVAPLFSRDVFSYAAQGDMMARHINPYAYGPYTLGNGPFVNPVDPLWMNTPAPYGPLFLMIAGWFTSITGYNALMTVVLLRLLSVVGVGMIAYCIPKLAQSYGRDPGPAFTLAVLNPLVLLALIGGAHNDAIMAGFLVAGITAAKRHHPIAGIVLCTLAAAIKIPAALGIVYVAWSWTGVDLSFRQRIRPLVTGGIISIAVMGFLSMISGIGWGWVANLGAPGTVRSWMAPATGIGMLISGVAHFVGIPVGQGGVLTVTRVLGLMTAAGVALYLLFHSDRVGSLKALGISMFLFVVLGPVVQPWYLTWGVILLAPIAAGKIQKAVITLSIIAPFIGLTGGRTLLDQLLHTDPVSMVVAVALLIAVLVAPLGRWMSSWYINPEPLISHRALNESRYSPV